MTAISAPEAVVTAPATTVGFANVLHSEWTKLRSLRSTYWCAGSIVLSVVGLAIFMGARWAHQSGPVPPWFDPTNVSLSGVYIAQIIIGALGVMTISSEYATGMIRATFTAVPQRRAVLAAKAVVLALATFWTAEVLCFVAFGSGQVLLANKGAGVSLGDPGILRAVFGAGLYLTATALLGFGLGAAIRHTAGGLSAFFGLLFAPSAIVDLLPTHLRNDLIDYMPANAGSQIFVVDNVKGALGPWTGLGVFCLYALAALVAGSYLTAVRDA
ncbi:MAG: ABC transporter permease [Actinomycetota bacterium]|nr:ABC transporter permease [Actinomycetota bacterium]